MVSLAGSVASTLAKGINSAFAASSAGIVEIEREPAGTKLLGVPRFPVPKTGRLWEALTAA
jgi:hypothetical protein